VRSQNVTGRRVAITAIGMQPGQGIELTGQRQECGALASAVHPAGRRRLSRRPALSLRSRLLLLVVASILPLIGLGLVREYWNYRAQRQQVYESLQTN
jgi:hypothetical protein